MAGKPGKSGGSRPNTGGARPNTGGSRPNTGGARKNAGRKPKNPADGGENDMLQFLQSVALGKIDATMIQVRAAVAAVQYTHTKTGDGGKKEAKEDAAKGAASGKFKPSAPPKLKVVTGK